MQEITTDSRKYIRYTIGEGNVIQLKFSTPQNSNYSTNSLIVDSSFGGVQVLLIGPCPPQPERSIFINFDELASFPARIVWLKQLDTNIYKLGIEYLE